MNSEHISDIEEVSGEAGPYWEAHCRAAGCNWRTNTWFWISAVRGALDHYDYDMRSQAQARKAS